METDGWSFHANHTGPSSRMPPGSVAIGSQGSWAGLGETEGLWQHRMRVALSEWGGRWILGKCEVAVGREKAQSVARCHGAAWDQSDCLYC